MNKIYFDSIVGILEIVAREHRITSLSFVKERKEEDSCEVLEECRKQLNEYFQGARKDFDLPLEPKGTPFQQKVWEALKKIPYGETRSYQEIAQMCGNTKASRAIGMANNRNPIAILIPCHRVIGKNGKLVGYAGGLDKKRKLLELEKKKN